MQFAEGGEHRAVVDGLRGGDRGVGVTHRRGGDGTAEQHHFGFDAKKRRVPQHQIGAFADFDRADFVGNAMRDGRVDGVFGDVAADAHVVVAVVAQQFAALDFHLMRGLPSADDDFADAAHRL